MSTTIGHMAVMLSANSSGFSAGFAVAQKATTSLVGSIGSLAKTGALVAGIGTLGKVLSTAWNGFTKSEDSQITYEALTGSALAAKKLRGELKDWGDTTPFGDGVGAAAKELLKFNFEAGAILPTLKTIGNIAAGVNVPLEELAGVIGKSGYRANISNKQLIALSEMGVPIMQELSRSMGLSQASITQLAEQGSIKFEDLMGAITAATSEGGAFYNMTERRANTTKGLITRVLDQTGDVIGKFGSVLGESISNVFGVKGGLSAVFDWLQGVEDGVRQAGSWLDVLVLGFQTVGEVANGLWGGMTAVFEAGWSFISGIFDSFGISLGSFRDFFTEALLATQFVFKNFGEFMSLGWLKIRLGMTVFGNDAVHLFMVNIPEILGWFSRNWVNVFTDVWEFTKTVFVNIGKNIWDFITSIPELIAGTKSFSDIWTPLTDGFKTSITEALKVTKREFNDNEKSLIASVANTEQKLSESWTDYFANGKKGMAAALEGRQKKAEEVDKFQYPEKTVGGALSQKNSKSQEAKYAGAIEAGSKEAYNVILRSRNLDFNAPAQQTATSTKELVKQGKKAEKQFDEIITAVEGWGDNFGGLGLDDGSNL